MAAEGRTTPPPREHEAAAAGAATPAALDLRPLLPGLEPERRHDDWGRSERAEALLDRALEPLLRLWLRVEVEGIEHVPASGGALLVANGCAAPSLTAVAVALALREEHPLERRPRLVAERISGLPGAAPIAAKLGCVAAHPANLQRLLHDEGELVLAFPERPGRPFRDRYRVSNLDLAALAAAALRARAPLVPICVVGADEAQPVFARLPALGLPLGPPGPLPAKLRLRALAPTAPARSTAGALADELRARLADGLRDMLRARRSVWLG
jgi:hypothetical protein